MLRNFFLFVLFLVIFTITISGHPAFSYSSPDIPVGHWSYGSIEKLAICGMASVAGIDTRPMTRVQMAYKIKEVIDNIEGEKIPRYLSMDRDQTEYLQTILYKMMTEFRQELVLIGVTSAQLKSIEEQGKLQKIVNYNKGSPIEVESRYVSTKNKNDILIENENGLRVKAGYNVRTRANAWANFMDTFTLSARPVLNVTGSGARLYLDEAGGKVSLSNVELSLAKSAMWWGPGYHGAMLMSNNAEPLTLVRIRSINDFKLPWVFQKLGFFGINFFASRLEKSRKIQSPDLIGLRLEWSPLPYLSFGASRTDISAGKGQPRPGVRDYWRMFIGSSELSSSPTPSPHDTDQLASVDARFVMPFKPEWRIASGMSVYTEYAGEDRFYVVRNELPGVIGGFLLTDLFRDKGTDLRFEYAKNKHDWYGHFKYDAGGADTAYTYKSAIMGHNMGTDAEDWFARISKDAPFFKTEFFNDVKMGCEFNMQTHMVTAPPSERLVEASADISWAHRESLYILLKYEFEHYTNFDFVSGASANNHIITAEMDIKF